jgi:protein-L-isoaspartate(D-aspartate) O-methyltransferase
MSRARPGARFPLALDRVAARVEAPAAKGAAAPALPATLGLESQAVRSRMIERIRAQGIDCAPVLEAMAQVPRHRFVDAALVAQAYEDTSLPIGHGQTISKPSVVARMLALLFEARPGAQRLGRVLEIGTGCGYQAALLSRLAARVISVERLRPLHDKARDNLAALRGDNLRLVYGDGRLGHPPNAPYDAIVSAAGGDDVPQAWLDQLAVGGRLVAPSLTQPGSDAQVLVCIDRSEAGWSRREHEGVRFVPLRSGTA